MCYSVNVLRDMSERGHLLGGVAMFGVIGVALIDSGPGEAVRRADSAAGCSRSTFCVVSHSGKTPTPTSPS
jgi:hypothetical protein